jgi:hypothetical protein
MVVSFMVAVPFSLGWAHPVGTVGEGHANCAFDYDQPHSHSRFADLDGEARPNWGSQSLASEPANEQKGPGLRPGPLLPSCDQPQRVNVCVKTVTPPWTTVMVALVKSMSVIAAVQLLFGHPA